MDLERMKEITEGCYRCSISPECDTRYTKDMFCPINDLHYPESNLYFSVIMALLKKETVYKIYQFCGDGAWEIDEHMITVDDIDGYFDIKGNVFLTKEDAENEIKRRESNEF